MSDKAEADPVIETEPPAMIPETGVAMSGDYPLNHRLRAEALATAGKDEDPDGLIDNALIADAGVRLEREAEAARIAEEERLAAFPPVAANMKVEDLERIAAEAEPPVDLSTAKNNADRVRLIEEARAATMNPTPPVVTPPNGGGEAGGDETKES